VRSSQRTTIGGLIAAVLLAAGILASAQSLPNEPRRASGASVTAAFEGWFRNPDGTFSLLIGYYNRNQTQELDVPIGPGNQIEPGGPDRGQPTHFRTGRQWGMFAIKVPSDFGQQRLTWTIVANGQTTSIPFYLHPDYEIAPLREAAVGNTPPLLAFDQGGPSVQGPLAMMVERTTTVAKPLALTAWVSDDAKFTSSSGLPPRALDTPVTITWTKYRGPGAVKFDTDRPKFEAVAGGKAPFNGKAVATVTFSQPGDYMLHATVNDLSGPGGGGFQCCWTTGLVKVSVAP
jgi:hypothetical protein